MTFAGRIRILAACVFPALTAVAQSNFDLDHSVIEVDSIGTLLWSPGQNGAVVNQFHASGYIYGANIGWISLGATPANKFQYANNSATDFGVNVTAAGALRGFAYGANIGWLHFEPLGNPRVDWISGKLAGRVWSANLGWIDLENSTQYLRIEALPEPPDSDQDGIADAWEIFHASNLTSLSRTADADSDGLADLAEYLAGTDPFDPADRLSLQVSVSANPRGSNLQFPTKASYVYVVDQRPILDHSSNWSPAAEKIIGTGTLATLNLPFSASHSFYRVRVFPPLSEP